MELFNKIFLFIIALLCLVNVDFVFTQDKDLSRTVIGNGIRIGSALAIAIFWTIPNSVLTSILAGFFGWLYVIYYLIIREKED